MTSEALMTARLQEVIDYGERVVQGHFTNAHEFFKTVYVHYGPYAGWRAQSLSLLTGLLGSTHPYTKAFDTSVTANQIHLAQAGLEILKAVLADFQRGYFTDLSTLISAEVFSDFLEMADHLLAENYKDPAAMLIGAVLEDGLRRILVNRDQTVTKEDGIASLSKKCVTAGLYSNLQQREVAVWTQIRNDADHGHFEQFTKANVEDMSQGVAKFLVEHLK